MTPKTPRLRWTGPTQRKDDIAANRTIKVAVSVNEDEYARWKAAAAEDGRAEVGRWVRETIEAGLESRPIEPPKPRNVAALRSTPTLALLRVQNRALNKIARELERLLAARRIATEADIQRIEAALIEAKQAQPE